MSQQISYTKVSRFDGQLPGEDPCRGSQNGADGPDGENDQEHLHPPGLGRQRPHDGLQEIDRSKKKETAGVSAVTSD